MKKLIAIKTVWQIIEAAIFVGLGIITIIFSNNATYWKVIGYVTGALLAIDGLLRLIIYFANNNLDAARMNLIICVSEVTLAVFIFICANVVVEYFTLLIAILLIVLGFVTLVDSIVKIVKKSARAVSIIAGIISACCLLVLGIVALCFFPYGKTEQSGGVNTISVMLVVSGIVLILGGVVLVVYTFIALNKIKKLTKEQNEEIAKQREEKRKAVK